jgi:threonine/homoserine/homoserine lactone efflux protein
MILGVGFGLPLMVALLGMGLSRVFDAAPQFYTAMKYAGAAYMLWLAWKIANAVPLRSDIKKTEPLTFLQGAAFQWVNPKGWVTSLTAIATYTTPSSYSQSLALVVLCCAFMSFTSSSAWALFGTALRGLMNNAKWFRAVNVTLAATLVLSLIPMLR